MFKTIAKLSVVLILTNSLSGCLVAGIGAGIGAIKYGSGKQSEAKAKSQQAYNDYIVEMAKINTERHKVGLKQESVMTYDQYVKK